MSSEALNEFKEKVSNMYFCTSDGKFVRAAGTKRYKKMIEALDAEVERIEKEAGRISSQMLSDERRGGYEDGAKDIKANIRDSVLEFMDYIGLRRDYDES